MKRCSTLIIFTRDFVSRESRCGIISLVTKIAIATNPSIILYIINAWGFIVRTFLRTYIQLGTCDTSTHDFVTEVIRSPLIDNLICNSLAINPVFFILTDTKCMQCLMTSFPDRRDIARKSRLTQNHWQPSGPDCHYNWTTYDQDELDQENVRYVYSLTRRSVTAVEISSGNT